jgi:signal transduction histidine kinase
MRVDNEDRVRPSARALHQTGGLYVTDDQPREVTTLRRLHELMCRVNAGEDLASVLQSLVDGVADVTGFAVAAVSYLHPDRHLEVVAVAGDDAARDQLIGTRTPLHEISREFELADDWGLLKFVPHERLDGETARGWIPDMRPLDVPDAWHPEDALLAPLSAPTGEMVGLLSVDLPRDGRRPGRFAREALEMYAAQAGIAISNAKQRERLREEVRLATAVRDVAQSAGNALDLGRVIDSGVTPILRGLSCDALWIRAFEGQGEVAGRGRGAIHSEPRLVPPDEVVALCSRLAERCWAERRAVILPSSHLAPADVTQAETETAMGFVAKTGCRTLLLAPLGAGPECLGYLVLGRESDASSWTDEEITAALEIGRDLGRAVLHARLYERERQLVQELQQLDRYKTEMISTLAHELKNPLTAIIGHLELLETAEDGTVTARSLAAIERGATRLSDLVSDLLVLSKVGDPQRPLLPAPVDLAEIVSCAGEMLQAQAAKQEVTIDLLGAGDKVTAYGDAAELDRVVSNLLSNAVKFSPAGGTVTCSVEQDDDTVVLRCSDEGIGISPEDQEQLFTEFFRSTNPCALEIPGTGLGLTIVKRIVERHSGTIALDSDLGKGATFTVTLPGAAAAV